MCTLLCGHKFSTLGKHQVGQFLECMIRVYLVLYEAGTLSSKAAVYFAFPQAMSKNAYILYMCRVALRTHLRLLLSVFQILVILIDV